MILEEYKLEINDSLSHQRFIEERLSCMPSVNILKKCAREMKKVIRKKCKKQKTKTPPE